MAVDRSTAAGAPGNKTTGIPVESGVLNRVLADAAGAGWSVARCDSQVLQASRQRPVLRYRVSYEHAGTTVTARKIVIGKAYYRGDGAGTFALMRRLWDEGFSDDSPLCIAEPIAWIPAGDFLLQGRAAGRPLYEHLPTPEEGIERVRAAGRWLAKLHATDVGATSRPLPRSFEADKLAVYAGALAAHPMGLGRRAVDVAEEVAGVLAAAEGGPLVPTHGDYQPKNIYVTRRRTTVIDFDRHALAPAARDLGHFLGQCLTMSWVRTGSFERIAPWNDAFLHGYGAAGRAAGLLPAYLARTFLEILYYKLVVKPVKDPAFAWKWLEECERWLEEARQLAVPAALPGSTRETS